MSDRDSRSTTPDGAARRIAQLRSDMPDVLVQIDSVRADDTAIAVKVTIALPGGARHSNIAALNVDPNRSWAEQHDQVQALATGRALDGLGIHAQQSQSADAQPHMASTAPPPAATRSIQEEPAPAPVVANQPPPGASAVQRVDGDHLPEYSWTSFWQTARARKITKEQVELALGRSIQQATPKDAVEALEAAGLWG